MQRSYAVLFCHFVIETYGIICDQAFWYTNQTLRTRNCTSSQYQEDKSNPAQKNKRQTKITF